MDEFPHENPPWPIVRVGILKGLDAQGGWIDDTLPTCKPSKFIDAGKTLVITGGFHYQAGAHGEPYKVTNVDLHCSIE